MKQTVSGGASASSQSARPGRFARLRRAVATFMGLALSGATAVAAQPAAVPQHWVSYAQLLGNQFQAWLGDDANPAVVRVHELMGGPKDAGDAVPPPRSRWWPRSGWMPRAASSGSSFRR